MVIYACSTTLNPQRPWFYPLIPLETCGLPHKNNKNLLFTLSTPTGPIQYSLCVSIMVLTVDKALPGRFFHPNLVHPLMTSSSTRFPSVMRFRANKILDS